MMHDLWGEDVRERRGIAPIDHILVPRPGKRCVLDLGCRAAALSWSAGGLSSDDASTFQHLALEINSHDARIEDERSQLFKLLHPRQASALAER